MRLPVRRIERQRNIEACVKDSSIEMAALRQLTWALADGDPDDYEHLVEGVHDAIDRVEDLEAHLSELKQENQDLRARLDRLGDISEEKTSKEQKIAAIVTYADNQRRSGQSRITVPPKEIQGVTDVSERYSYTLVDDMVGGEGDDGPDGYDWALNPQRQARRPDQDLPQKGVLIDFEQLHADPEALSKFINATDAEGVAD